MVFNYTVREIRRMRTTNGGTGNAAARMSPASPTPRQSPRQAFPSATPPRPGAWRVEGPVLPGLPPGLPRTRTAPAPLPLARTARRHVEINSRNNPMRQARSRRSRGLWLPPSTHAPRRCAVFGNPSDPAAVGPARDYGRNSAAHSGEVRPSPTCGGRPKCIERAERARAPVWLP